MQNTPDWTVAESRGVYNTGRWGNGYFDADAAGRLRARCPRRPEHPGVDLYALAQELVAEGQSPPVLVRFPHIIHDRVDTLCEAFAGAIGANGYQADYTAVYPIKVNQQRSVVSAIVEHGAERVGLEAGSKPELMAVLALSRRGGIVICNGYKDREYVRLALIARRLELNTVLVVEKLSELELIIDEAAALGIEPRLGIRVRLASMGKGNWQNTGGEKSKFGLSAAQVLTAVERLRAAGLAHTVVLLHSHLGSQIANVRDIQRGLQEVGRYYAELRALGLPVDYVDVGGGLGVDYEGTGSRSACSMNYTVREYANNVVCSVLDVCTQHGLPHPRLITESGRALTAHHAMLITNVIDHEAVPGASPPPAPVADAALILHNLWQVYGGVARGTAVEAYHDAVYLLAEAQSMFGHGALGLAERAWAEHLFFSVCRMVLPLLNPGSRAHREIVDEINDKLAEKFFVNLSIFQSMPDVWALEQIFPIMPLHRLDEAPTSRAVLQDLTCDSDGCIEHYVDGEGVESSLPLPPYRPGEPYFLGIFMVGAYQEILGDMHNLFGDTNAVNVELTADGYRVCNPERGDTVAELLRYVHFEPEQLLDSYRQRIDAAGLDAATRALCMDTLRAGLEGYSYLED